MALTSGCCYVILTPAFRDPCKALYLPWFSQPNHLDSAWASDAGNRLGESILSEREPSVSTDSRSLGLHDRGACITASLLQFSGSPNSVLLPAGRWYSCVARRPHQFPHSYIQGMSCCVLHLPGILRETQDRRTCEDLSYKQWKHLGETEKENSFKREVGKEMF